MGSRSISSTDGPRLLFDLDPHLVPHVVGNEGRTQSADSGNIGRREHGRTVERAPAGMDVFRRSLAHAQDVWTLGEAPRRGLRLFAVSESAQVLVEGQDACVAFVSDRAEQAVV